MAPPHLYRLHSAPTIAWLAANRWGHAGELSGSPSFPDHETALRASTQHPNLWTRSMNPTPHYGLTEADVLSLRYSLRPEARIPDPAGPVGAPYILWGSSDDIYILHAYGRTVAVHANIALLAACLRNERAEPGWIRRIMDPAEDPYVSTLNPYAAMKERQRRQGQDAERKAHDEARADARRSRTVVRAVTADLDLDDLL